MEEQSSIAVAELSLEKIDIFSKTLLATLSSERATETFAQVIDGKPTAKGYGIPIKYWNRNYTNTTTEEVNSRLAPNQESVQLFEEFRKNLRPSTVRISTETAQAFQMLPLSSEEFQLRLLEMIAVAVHTIAVRTYEEFHPELSFPHSEQREGRPYLLPSLYHPDYMFSRQYPHGRADIVGYWAESRIFGGVVLFDHDDISQDRLLGAYINPLAPWLEDPMVYQLSQAQVLEFYEMSQNKGSRMPLPFSAGQDAKLVEPREAFGMNIYRARYEKNPPPIYRPSCVVHRPEVAEWIRAYVRDNRPPEH